MKEFDKLLMLFFLIFFFKEIISLQYFYSICSIFDVAFTHSVDGVL